MALPQGAQRAESGEQGPVPASVRAGGRGAGEPGTKTMGPRRHCPPLGQTAAQTYVTFQCRLVVAQERNLEVRADKFPTDAALAGVFLDALQHCAGFTEQLLTWRHQTRPLSPRGRPARQQDACPASPYRDQHSLTLQQAEAAKLEADEAEWGPLRSERNGSATPSHRRLSTFSLGILDVSPGENGLSYTRTLRACVLLLGPEQRFPGAMPTERWQQGLPRPDADLGHSPARGCFSLWTETRQRRLPGRGACRQLPVLQRLPHDHSPWLCSQGEEEKGGQRFVGKTVSSLSSLRLFPPSVSPFLLHLQAPSPWKAVLPGARAALLTVRKVRVWG